MNQELKEQARKEFEKSADTADQFVDNAKVIPLNSAILLCNLAIDKTVQITEERIVDLIERQYGDVVTTNKDVAIPHNCLEYETALDDIITLITNKSDINKDTL